MKMTRSIAIGMLVASWIAPALSTEVTLSYVGQVTAVDYTAYAVAGGYFHSTDLLYAPRQVTFKLSFDSDSLVYSGHDRVYNALGSFSFQGSTCTIRDVMAAHACGPAGEIALVLNDDGTLNTHFSGAFQSGSFLSYQFNGENFSYHQFGGGHYGPTTHASGLISSVNSTNPNLVLGPIISSVPEPGTLAFFVFGVVVLSFWGGDKRQVVRRLGLRMRGLA